MDTNRMKQAAQWLYEAVFRDEPIPIRPRGSQNTERLPPLLRTARSLETGAGLWQSRESVFLKQGKLLANYEDDFPFHGNLLRYYPTYQALTDQELRGYFSWRTRLRRGETEEAPLSFAFLYIYELINQIGVSNPQDGYRKLRDFQQVYGQIDERIAPYLNRWLTDYVVYYELDAELLADQPQVIFDKNVAVLENIRNCGTDQVIRAVKQLSGKWLERSKFYGEYQEDMDAVIYRVLCRISDHYAKCKKGFTEQLFGSRIPYEARPFDSAVFCDPLKRRNYEYALDERCVYQCKNGFWTVTRYPCCTHANTKLAKLLKTIDSIMREAYAYMHPVKPEVDTKWITKMVQEEVQKHLAAKKAAEAKKITIDYGKLSKIRQDAAITQEKLTVEEELEEDEPAAACPEPVQPEPAQEPEPSADSPLNPAEYRLLQSLLYGKDRSWVRTEGYILSVLLDGINDKLYDTFLDSVVDDTPSVTADYIEDLKEMIKP